MYMYMLKTSIQRSFLQQEQCLFLFETYTFLHITCNQFINFIPFLSVYQLYSILTSTLTFDRHHLKSLIITDVKEKFLCTGHITNRLLTKWCQIKITAKNHVYIYSNQQSYMVVPSYEDKSKADWIGSEASQIESPTKCTSPLSQ